MKQRKIRFLAFFLVLTLLLTTAPLVSAEGDEDAVPMQDGFTYHIPDEASDGDRVATVTGYVAVKEADEVTVPAAIEDKPVRFVIFGEENTASLLKRLTIPEGVLYFECTSSGGALLEELILPSTLKVICGAPHSDMLKSVTVPYSVSIITSNAFAAHTVLRVEKGSYAERWAKANEQPYEIIEHRPSAGDYDADGLCTSSDARLLLQYEAGKLAFTDEQLAVGDVDGDGDITSTDARLVLQYAAGKIELEAIEAPRTFRTYLFEKDMAATVEKVQITDSIFSYEEKRSPITDAAALVDFLNQTVSQSYENPWMLPIHSHEETVWIYGKMGDVTVKILPPRKDTDTWDIFWLNVSGGGIHLTLGENTASPELEQPN